MLARTRIIALLIFLAVAGHTVYHTWHISDHDREFFAKLSKQPEENPQPLTSQEKRNVTKDAYYTKGKERQRTHIAADTSTLRAIPIGKTYELIETMHGISGTMVDKDQKRTFASNEGTYFYNTHQFITKMASVKLFSDKLLVDGLAKEVKLRFSSDGAKFEASQIKAHIPDTKELK